MSARIQARFLVFSAFFGLDVAGAMPARAGDGVVEINQTCAVATGCFSGDTPGFPVSIDGSAGKSYRLTSDLVIATPGTSGIFVLVSRVSIDLNRFEVRGPTVCSGSTVLENSVTQNADGGMSIGSGAIASRNVVRGSGGVGLNTGYDAELAGNVSTGNAQHGIGVTPSTSYRDDDISNNGSTAIFGTGLDLGGNVCNGSTICP